MVHQECPERIRSFMELTEDLISLARSTGQKEQTTAREFAAALAGSLSVSFAVLATVPVFSRKLNEKAVDSPEPVFYFSGMGETDPVTITEAFRQSRDDFDPGIGSCRCQFSAAGLTLLMFPCTDPRNFSDLPAGYIIVPRPSDAGCDFEGKCGVLEGFARIYGRVRSDFRKECEISEREKKFRMYLNHSKDLIWAADTSFNFEYMSPAVMDLRGFTPEETLKQTISEMYTPESVQKIMAAYVNAMHQLTLDPDYKGLSEGIECLSYCRDGFHKWIEVNAHFFRDDNGQVTGFVGNSRDIHSRKIMEEKISYLLEFGKIVTGLATNFINLPIERVDEGLHDALARIGEFGQVDSDWIFLASEDGTRMSLTSQWLAPGTPDTKEKWQDIPIADFTWFISELQGSGIFSVARLSDIPDERESLREFISSRGVRAFVCVPLVIDGQMVGIFGLDCMDREMEWSEEIKTIVKIAGEIFSNALARMRSETELARYRSHLETIVEERTAELRASEEKFKAIFESTTDCIVVWDTEFKRLYANRAALEHRSSWPFDVTAENLRSLEKTVPSLAELWEGRICKVAREGQSCTGNDIVEIGAKTYYIDSTFSQIHDSGGRIFAVGAIYRDVTDRKRLEEELFNAKKMESLGVFAGGIAHDFNNLLTIMIGSLQIAKIKLKGGDGNPVYTYIDKAEKCAYRSRDISAQFLTFSKGGAPVKKTSSITDIIRESIDFATRGSKVKVNFSLDELSPVDIDQGQISQVINNLIINATQAMPNGGHITIRGRNVKITENDLLPVEPGNFVHISVIDEGLGIPREIQSKIFDPFFSTKEDGHGLGLSLSYSIIRRHRGHIGFTSLVDCGTTFDIFLPESRGTIEAEVDDGGLIFGHGRILVMDDEEDIRLNLKFMLSSIGYEVAMAREGSEAIDLYVEALEAGLPFDAVILDLTVPGGMCGKETIENIIKIDPAANAIVSSGYSNDPIMAGYIEFGFKGILFKPYLIEELSRVVAEVVGSTARMQAEGMA